MTLILLPFFPVPMKPRMHTSETLLLPLTHTKLALQENTRILPKLETWLFSFTRTLLVVQMSTGKRSLLCP